MVSEAGRRDARPERIALPARVGGEGQIGVDPPADRAAQIVDVALIAPALGIAAVDPGIDVIVEGVANSRRRLPSGRD